MRQAIQTKFLGPTNFRGSRVKAFCAAGSLIHSWDHSQNDFDNHQAAALKLQVKLGWAEKNSLFAGSLKDGSLVFVQQARGKNLLLFERYHR